MNDRNQNNGNKDNRNIVWIGIVIILAAIVVYFIAYHNRAEVPVSTPASTTYNSDAQPNTNNQTPNR